MFSTTVANGAAAVTYSIPGGTPVGGYSIDAVYNAAASTPTSRDLTGNSGTLNINNNPVLVPGLTNPNFEDGVVGWQGFGTGGSNSQFNVIAHASVTSTITVGGAKINAQSLTKFGEVDSITGGNAPAVIYQNISVLPGGILTGYYNFSPGTSTNAELQIELIACDPNGAPPCTVAFPTVSSFPVKTTAATNGWVPFSFTFPAGTSFTTWALNLVLSCPTVGGTESCPNAIAAFDNFTYTLPLTTTTVTDTATPFSATAQDITLNATVAGGSPVNEGTVTFTVKQGATTIGNPVTSGTVTNGAATATYTLPAGTAAGSYTIVADFNIAPTNTHFQASSGTGTLTIGVNATTTAVANVETPFSTTAQNVTLTATVTSSTAVNEGTVTFTVKQGTTTIGAPVTSGTVTGGLASVAYSLPGGTASGNYTITAVYNPAATTPKFGTSTGTGTLTVKAGSGPVATTGLQYYPLSKPVRLLDTRPGATAFVHPNKSLAGGGSLTVSGHFSYLGVTVPAEAQALVGNATVDDSIGAPAGFASLQPSNGSGTASASVKAASLTSNLNFVPGTVRPNAFTVALGADGSFTLFSSTGGDFIIDISGYYAPPGTGGLYFHTLSQPVRLLDTRAGNTAFVHPGATLTAGQTLNLPGRFTYQGVTVPASAQAIFGNATVANDGNATPAGFATIFPGGTTLPLASNLNFVPKQVAPNAFTVGLGGDGSFNLFSNTGGDFVIDVTGYFDNVAAGGLLFTPLSSPVRELDTRGLSTAVVQPNATLTAGQTLNLPGNFAAQGVVVPASAKALVGNATVANDANTTPAGFATLFPNGGPLPLASNLNFVPKQVAPNAFIVGVGANGTYNLYTSSGGDFVIDITGYFS